MQAKTFLLGLTLAGLVVGIAGCASVSVHTHAYLGSPKAPPTNPAAVGLLSAQPTRPFDRLGEIVLGVEGNPSRETIEQKLRQAAAQLGANAAFVTFDRMHVFPVVYGGAWGPVGVAEAMRRDIVAVAVKYK